MPAITLIQSLPNFVSEDEYGTIIGSTPSSFATLPSVIKHKEENTSVKIDPPIEGFTEEDAKNGTLYVLTRYFHSSFIWSELVPIHV